MAGVLDGFLSTWSNARTTFGQGDLPAGADYDRSSQLRQAQSDLAGAAPGSLWSGAAATAYGKANDDHRQVIGQLAGLDQRLSAQVDRSADVVTKGRQDLDAVRKWVVDAAANVPNNAAGQRMLVPIVNKGIGQVMDIVQKTNGELSTIGGNVRGIGAEYTALGNQKFAKEGTDGEDPLGVQGDDKDGEEVERNAKEDVEKTLEGDQEAAGRVDQVLGQIKPYQELTPQQAAYLNEMQRQQSGMSIPDLQRAEARLGDKKNVIGDSWQLMSNDDVPRESGKVDATTPKGGFDRLPDSVQKILSQEGLGSRAYTGDVDDVKAIAQIVEDGHSELQTGTELDREMMRLSDRIMDDSNTFSEQHDVVTDIFDSAGRDHTIVRDMVTGIKGDDGDDFLHDINNYRWDDDGKSAGHLFDWTHDAATGPESQIAAETAEKVAGYLGSHHELMKMPDGFSDTTLGQANPELVRAYAHGLTPYMADIASLDSANQHDAFDNLDPGNPERPNAKNVFAVLSTDEQAYKEFNGAADALNLTEAHQYAEDVKNHVPVSADDKRLLDSAVLKGLVASGSAESAHVMGQNEDEALNWRKAAYAAGTATLGVGASPAAGVALAGFGSLMESSVIGEPANPNSPVVPDMTDDESARFVLNALIADGVHAQGLDDYMIDGRIASMHEMLDKHMSVPADTGFQDDLNDALNDIVGKENNPSAKISGKYGQIIKIPGGS
jgi:hypothetical protein